MPRNEPKYFVENIRCSPTSTRNKKRIASGSVFQRQAKSLLLFMVHGPLEPAKLKAIPLFFEFIVTRKSLLLPHETGQRPKYNLFVKTDLFFPPGLF